MEHPTRGLNGTALRIAMVTLCLVLMAILPSLAAGFSQPANRYTVIVLTEQKTYEVGDEATIEIRFYDKDSLTDSTEINITIEGDSNERYLQVDEASARQSEGVYRASFTIKEEDLDYYGDTVDGTVSCNDSDSRSEKSAEASFSVVIADEELEGFEIEVVPDKPFPGPGDTVRFSIDFTHNNQKVNPDEISYISLNVNEEHQYLSEDELVNDSTGKKHYDYTIPENTTASQEISLSISAEYSDESRSGLGEARMDFYQVWLHIKKLTRTDMTGEIGVCDMTGALVPASIYLAILYDDSEPGYNIIRKEKTGQTEATGLMYFSVAFTGKAEDVNYVNMEVWANGTGTRTEQYQQFVDNGFSLPYKDEIPDDMFYIEEQQDYLDSGKEVTASYKAYSNGTPLANKDIYFYFYDYPAYYVITGETPGSMGKVHHVGKATTDSNGSFSTNFTTPDRETYMVSKFKADFGGTRSTTGDWRETDKTLYIGDLFGFDDDMTISVSDFELGKMANISVSKSGMNGGKAGMEIIPIDKSVKSMMDLMFEGVATWNYLNGEPDIDSMPLFAGSSFTRNVGIPAFLPTDMNFLILVRILEEDNTGKLTYSMNYIIVDKDGKVQEMEGDDSDDDDDDDDDGFLPGFETYMMVASVVLVAVLVSRRRRR